MKYFNLFILLFIGSVHVLFAQEDCQRSHCNWEFFDLEETVRGEVIYHEALFFSSDENVSYKTPRQMVLVQRGINANWNLVSSCPSLNCLSVTILRINQDTVRILNYSGDWLAIGSQIYVIPSNKRETLNFISHRLEKNGRKKKKGWRKDYKAAKTQLPMRFDTSVLKTSFGYLSNHSDEERQVFDCEQNQYKPIQHNSFQCRWNFFEIEKPIEGRIIKYEAQTQPCHLVGYASLAIVVINNNQDTIRVLDCCNSATFEEGATVIIEDGKYTNPVSIPYSKTIEDDQEMYRSNKFDNLVFRTTYGKLIRKEN